jgi:hypothetical protein
VGRDDDRLLLDGGRSSSADYATAIKLEVRS